MPTTAREDRRQQRKYERQAALRKAEKRDKVRRWSFLGGGLALVVIGAIVIAFLATRGGGSGTAAAPLLPGEQHFNDPVTASGGLYKHVPDTQPVKYDQTPPNHGDHYDTPMPWGAYDSPVPEGRFVHDLEHGGIDVLYHCPTGCADVVTQLKNLMTTLPKEHFGEVKAVVTPYDKGTHLISLIAWDYELDLDAYDFNTIKAFYDEHVDKGPEQIP
ncbi:MAG: DUF3105 domain-containing protein [Chloroflexi bacterium]|nr:DUF3105 domain-containing protein [Chloroflexota bacterium]